MQAFSGNSFLKRPPFERLPMKALYDLLGARVDDDAEALKKAFREAVKAHHPDLHPGDPEAPLRFTQIVAAAAILRDAKQRATYDHLLQLELQQHRLKVECQQLRSKLDRQQLRFKRMRATAAVAVLGALVGGYGLFAPMPATTVVAIKEDGRTVTTVGMDKKNRQTAIVPETIEPDKDAATVIAADEQNENGSRAVGAAGRDDVKGDMDRVGEPVGTAGAQPGEPANPASEGEPSHKRDSADAPGEVIEPRATAYAMTSGDARVIADRELALAPQSKDASFYRERGNASYRSGDFPRAIVNFDEAIRLAPNDAQAYNIRANAWDEMGMFERALADYDEAIRLDPNNPALFRDRAIQWQRRGALDKALVDLDRAIRFSFTDANIYCDRGLVWYEKGRHDRAIADFNQAFKLDPNVAAACINRGLIVHRNSEFNVAFLDGRKTIRVDPSIFDVIRRPNLRR
jgi:tetratricopeptide (TPR) repeat protein